MSIFRRYGTVGLTGLSTLCLMILPDEAGAGNDITVSTLAQLTSAVAKAEPGDTILVKNGDYSKKVTVSGKGDGEKPIVIKAESVGGVTILRPLTITGRNLVLSGFHFKKSGTLSVRNSQNCRLTRCSMNDVQSGKWLTVDTKSREIEIDHCLFENKTNNKALPRGCQLMQITLTNTNESHHIHHNHFRDIPKGSTGNGFETLQLISKGNPKNPKGVKTGNIVEYNLFERCDGEAEIISVKSNGNILRYNLFRECRGGLVLRHGRNSTIDGNVFLGNNKPGTQGIRVTGTGQVIINNYFHKVSGNAISMMDGTDDDFYLRVERAMVAFNTVVDCGKSFYIGQNHSKYPDGTAPIDCSIIGNILSSSNQEKSLITYVKGHEPVDWKWSDNIYAGKLGVEVDNGIAAVPPRLHVLDNGLASPSSNTPSVSELPKGFKEIKVDLLGRPRTKPLTLGAIQFPVAPSAVKPLSASDVGP